MQRRHFIALAGLTSLASCGYWPDSLSFRRDEPQAELAPEPVDQRPIVAQVTDLVVDRTPSGVILRVKGLPPRQGYYDGELVPVPSEDEGVLAYQLHAQPPHYETPASTTRSREFVVARFLSNDNLTGIRTIRVSGSSNTLSARR